MNNTKVEKGNKISNFIIIFLILTLLLQMIGITKKDETLDTLYKNIVFALIFIYSAIDFFRKGKKINTKVLLVIIIYILSQFITVSLNGDFNYISVGLFNYLIYPIALMIIFYIFFGETSISEKNITHLCNLYLIFILYACLYNVIQNYNDFSNVLNISNSYQIKFSSFFINRNTFAFYLLFGMIASIVNILLHDGKKKKYIIAMMIIGINLFFTLSRTATIAFIVFMLVLLLKSRNKKIIIITFVFAIMLIIAINTNDTIKTFIIDNFIRYESGVTGRGELFNIGIKIFNEGNSLVGSGYIQPFDEVYALTDNGSFINTYITILVCGGIVMFIFFIIVLWNSILNSLKVKKYNKQLSNIYISIIIAYLVYAIGENLILFGANMNNYIATIFVVFLPYYSINYYSKKGADDIGERTN